MDENAYLQSDGSLGEDSSEEELLNGGDQELDQDSDTESETGSEQEDLGEGEDQNTETTGSKSKADNDNVSEGRQDRKSESCPKRTVKPVVRLTYDEPGKARDQPITIIHRGVVIKIGKGKSDRECITQYISCFLL